MTVVHNIPANGSGLPKDDPHSSTYKSAEMTLDEQLLKLWPPIMRKPWTLDKALDLNAENRRKAKELVEERDARIAELERLIDSVILDWNAAARLGQVVEWRSLHKLAEAKGAKS